MIYTIKMVFLCRVQLVVTGVLNNLDVLIIATVRRSVQSADVVRASVSIATEKIASVSIIKFFA